MDSDPILAGVPEGWTVVDVSRAGPFLTRAVLERPDGTRVRWSSRRHRKALGLQDDVASVVRRAHGRASGVSMAMGALFAIGSVCFAVGSVPWYFDNVSPSVAAWTFFVGSLFFTTAAFLQFDEVLRSPAEIAAVAAGRRHRVMARWRLRTIDWWAAGVQLVGTVFFNVTTFAATRGDLSVTQVRRLVWAPDVYGSICFLVASWLAYAEVNRGIRPRPDGSTGWVIALVNLVGSIAFGISAVAARIVPSTGQVTNEAWVNLGTFAGAVCFFIGALLLPAESARDRADPGGPAPGS